MTEAKSSNMWGVLGVLIIGTFISVLNSSLINIALPKMMAVFSVDLVSIQWVVTAYTIALGAVIPLSGYLSDVMGSKKLYIWALGLFTLGTLLCGMAWSNNSMIAFRVIQGIGGGLIGPVGTAILFRTVPPEKMGVAMGLYGVSAMAAPAIGPTLGGYIIASLSWRVLFYICVPIGVLGVIMGFLMLEEMPTKPPGTFDLIGFITSSVGLICIFYVLGKWTSINWHEMGYPLLLALGIFCLILFAVNELMHPNPLLDLRILKFYDFTAWTMIASVLSMTMIGITYLIPIFLQSIVGYSAIQTGLLLFPSAIATAVMMPVSGKLFDKYGYRAVMIPGLLLLAAASYPFAFLNTDTSSSTINLLMILRGAALGMAMMPPSALAMQCIPKALINQASSLTNIIRQVAGTVSVALITTMLQNGITLNSARIAEQISSVNPIATDTVKVLQGVYMKGGLTASESGSAALSTLGGLVQKQAYVDAIDHILFLMLIVAVITLAFVVLFEVPKYMMARMQSIPAEEEAITPYE